ncbi:hypothetical protein O7632_26145 [Solwaraspora sp. WMMD406]|uniref:hypothetical protein n=1 Tax=Solwaraspora sp. WMMD406 TaxID=3016095 RepID=UPI002416A5B0|nr:hypothetical protein [Solwaraspora sp. WMMD406]MDG4767545.1 hypothetical protein [Solwaraspora sp. WMMD406]
MPKLPSTVRLGAPTDRYYDRLVRLAYLVMADATEAPAGAGTRRPARPHGVIRAHRIVRRSLPWRPLDDAGQLWMLARVIRRASRPRRFTPPVFQHWGRPIRSGHDPEWDRLFAALATLPAPVRAGYLLLVVEQLSPRDAILVLHEAGWPDAVVQVAAGAAERQRLADTEGLSPDRQRALLTGPVTDPMTVRLQAPDLRTLRLVRALRLTGAAGAALVVAAVSAAVLPGLPDFPPSSGPAGDDPAGPVVAEVRRVGEQAWTGSAALTLASWPTRGSRLDDPGLVEAAVDAWLGLAAMTLADPATSTAAYGARGGGGDPDAAPAGVAVATDAGMVTATGSEGVGLAAPVGGAQLLYVGDLPEGSAPEPGGSAPEPDVLVVLADATRIAVYRQAGRSRSLRIEPAPAAHPSTSSAIRLTGSDGTARYLVAPWVTAVESRALSGDDWVPLPVGATGLTDPAPAGPDGCWSGPVLRVLGDEIAGGRGATLADLGRTALTWLAYLPPGAHPGRAPENADAPGGGAVWARLGCLTGELAAHTPRSVLAWEVWSGSLPGASDPVRLVCLRAELPQDASMVAAVLLAAGPPARAVATAADTRSCSSRAPAVVVGWWWESSDGAWHHVAVGGGPVAEIEVRVSDQTMRGAGLLVSPAYPDGPVGPVRIGGTDAAGRPVPVLG